MQHCDGIQALMYARLRKIDGDFARTARQRHLLELLLNKVLQDMDTGKLLNLISTCLPYMITNMNAQTIMNVATAVLKTDIISRAKDGGELLQQHRIPMDKTYSYGTTDKGASVIELSSKQWDNNIQSLHYFIYGNYYPAQLSRYRLMASPGGRCGSAGALYRYACAGTHAPRHRRPQAGRQEGKRWPGLLLAAPAAGERRAPVSSPGRFQERGMHLPEKALSVLYMKKPLPAVAGRGT